MQQHQLKDMSSGKIVTDACFFEKDPAHGDRFICNLKAMQVKSIDRKDKKYTESVLNEKFTVVFRSILQMCNMTINVSRFHEAIISKL